MPVVSNSSPLILFGGLDELWSCKHCSLRSLCLRMNGIMALGGSAEMSKLSDDQDGRILAVLLAVAARTVSARRPS